MNDRQLAAMLIEKVADANINKKIAVFVNRLILRLHSQPALLSNLSDITVFKPGFEGETVDQVEDGEFKESVDDLDTANAPAKEDEEKDANTSVILQLSFRRLPQEVITPLIRLLASPREPKLFQYTKDGAARFGVEIELRPSDFPGDDLDYSF